MKRTRWLAALAALALAVCLAPMAAFATGDGTPAATPKNVYLDTVSGDDAKDGTQGSPVKTLAKALELAEDGDTVLVSGSLNNITGIDKPVTIEGAGSSPVPVTGTVALPQNVSDLKLKNLSFDGYAINEYGSAGGYETLRLVIEGCTFNNASNNCVYITPTIESLTVTRCVFTAPDGDTYRAQYLIWPYEAKTITITGNQFDGKGMTRSPIHLGNGHPDGTTAEVSDNEITGFERGVLLAFTNASANTVKISQNTFTNVALSAKTPSTKPETGTVYIHKAQTGNTKVSYLDNTLAGSTQRAICTENTSVKTEDLVTAFSGNHKADGTDIGGLAQNSFTTYVVLPGSGTEQDPFVISTVEQLKALQEKVNGGDGCEGEYYVLGGNIDLFGETSWTPIGNGRRDGSGYTGDAFRGVFDGKNYTITGLTIRQTLSDDAVDDAVGLFGVLDGGTVKDVKFGKVTMEVSGGECVGGAVGLMVNNATVSGVTVGQQGGSTITAVRGLGGIVGRMTISGTIENCTNYAAINGSGANVGGIVGAAYYTGMGSEMSINGCHNHGTVTCTAGATGGIVGLSAAKVAGCTNTAAVTGNGADVAGIVAEQQNAGSVTGCVNSGAITNRSTAYGTGGIVGWVRYNGSATDYPRKNIIEVTGNTNSGAISGGNDGGGIVGTVYNAAVVTGNENSAPSISSANFAAGIVANLQYVETPAEGESGAVIPDHSIVLRNNVSKTPIESIQGTNTDLYTHNNEQPEQGDTHDVADNAPAWAAEVNGARYTTLAQAFQEAADGQTVKLLGNVALSDTLQLNEKKAVTLELNGKTITDTRAADDKAYSFILSNGAALTVTDSSADGAGTIDSNYRVFKVGDASISSTGTPASLTLNGGKLAGGDCTVAVYANNTGDHSADKSVACTVTVNKATLDGGVYVFGQGATLNVNEGAAISASAASEGFAISGNGSNNSSQNCGGTVINITGGTITNNNEGGVAIYHPQEGVLNISGSAQVTGASVGVEMRAGTLNVKPDAKITGGSGTPTSAGNGNGTTASNAAVAVSQHTTTLPITVNISGGTLTGGAAFYETNPQNNPNVAQDVKVSITGGTFSGQILSEDLTGFISGGSFKNGNGVPGAYLAPGFKAEAGAGGVITVSVDVWEPLPTPVPTPVPAPAATPKPAATARPAATATPAATEAPAEASPTPTPAPAEPTPTPTPAPTPAAEETSGETGGSLPVLPLAIGGIVLVLLILLLVLRRLFKNREDDERGY